MRYVVEKYGSVVTRARRGAAGRPTKRLRSLLLAAIAASTAGLALPSATGRAWAGTAPYIVADLNGTSSSVALGDVTGVGGTVVEPLDAADAVLAQLTPTQVSALQALSGVVVTPDVTVAVQASVSSGTHKPSAVFGQETSAASLWR